MSRLMMTPSHDCHVCPRGDPVHPARRLTSMVLGTALLVVSLSPSVTAQDPSPVATPSPMCGVLTADEVGSALGLPMAVTTSEDNGCNYETDYQTTGEYPQPVVASRHGHPGGLQDCLWRRRGDRGRGSGRHLSPRLLLIVDVHRGTRHGCLYPPAGRYAEGRASTSRRRCSPLPLLAYRGSRQRRSSPSHLRHPR